MEENNTETWINFGLVWGDERAGDEQSFWQFGIVTGSDDLDA